MRRIINTFKKGSGKAKLFLILALLTGVLSVCFVILSFFTGQLLFFFGAVVSLFVTISLFQSFNICGMDITESDTDGNTNDENTEDKNAENINAEEDNAKDENAEEDNAEEDNAKDENVEDKNAEDEKTGENKKKTVKEKTRKEKKKTPKNRKTKKNKKSAVPEATDKNDIVSIPDMADADKGVSDNPEKAEPLTIEEAQKYNRKLIKKTMHKFKVKRDHRLVLIDRCERFNISQTPAYIWVQDKEFHILLIEKEPRQLIFPVYSIKNIKYLKKQPANPDIDYAVYKTGSVISGLFGKYVPDYVHSTVVDDLTAYKNLYGIGPDMYFTNRSAKNLMDLLPAEFSVEDKVTTSNKVNIYFKEAYKANILLRDNVIDANGYADRISVILDNMAKSTISYNEFKETLNLMIKNKLITQEFAAYYKDVRDKNVR